MLLEKHVILTGLYSSAMTTHNIKWLSKRRTRSLSNCSANSSLHQSIQSSNNHNTTSCNHPQMSSSKNSLYSNFMETGITVLCKTGKNKIKKFNIKQGYCHNTRIWNSTFPYRLLQVPFSPLFDCAIHNFKSKNMKQK